MRNVSARLMASDQLGRDFFQRGEEDVTCDSREVVYTASLLDVLQAYARLKTKDDFEPLHLKRSFVVTPEQALEIINTKLKKSTDWQELKKFVPEIWKKTPQSNRTAMATSFAVFLELARLKKVDIMQSEIFAPMYLRRTENF